MLATNSLETPVLGLVAQRDGERLRSRRRAAAPRQLRIFRGRSQSLALATTSRCSAVSSPDRTRWRNSRAARRSTPTIIRWSPISRRASPMRRIPLPRDRLLELLGHVDNEPAESARATATRTGSARLVAYWQARDRYLELGRDVRPTFDVREMLAQVRDPLLSRAAHQPGLSAGLRSAATHGVRPRAQRFRRGERAADATRARTTGAARSGGSAARAGRVAVNHSAVSGRSHFTRCTPSLRPR